MKKIIKELYNFGATLLGAGYENALLFVNKLIPLDIIEIPSGTKVGTWTVPDEWVVKDAWVKFKGKKILDYKKNPLCLMVYSEPIHAMVDDGELKKHLHYSEEMPNDYPYTYSFYRKNWGFSMPKNKLKKKIEQECEGGTCTDKLKDIDPSVGKVRIQGTDYSPKFEDILPEGEYEVFVDSEFRKGTMKIGVHTIKGKTDREVLLLAHLDHPYQANDNLSSVACLINMAKKIKKAKFDHTVKLIFCPETIGSIAYALTQDISKVDFVIAADIVGNDNTLLIQKAYDPIAKINKAVHLAVAWQGVSYRKGVFRHVIGSDEYAFNDPKIGIPGIMLSRYPYKEYHTSADTPEIINEDKIKEVQKVILKTIEIMEKDFIPVRNFVGPLFRQEYKIFWENNHLLNRDTDCLIYNMDGKKSLVDLIMPLGLSFDFAYETLMKLKDDKLISIITSKKRQQKTSE